MHRNHKSWFSKLYQEICFAKFHKLILMNNIFIITGNLAAYTTFTYLRIWLEGRGLMTLGVRFVDSGLVGNDLFVGDGVLFAWGVPDKSRSNCIASKFSIISFFLKKNRNDSLETFIAKNFIEADSDSWWADNDDTGYIYTQMKETLYHFYSWPYVIIFLFWKLSTETKMY